MRIFRSLFQLWIVLTLVSLLVDLACFWLVQTLPAAQSPSQRYIYPDLFFASVLAPFLLGPALIVLCLALNLAWTLLLALAEPLEAALAALAERLYWRWGPVGRPSLLGPSPRLQARAARSFGIMRRRRV